MSHGLSFKTIKDSSKTKFKAKLAAALEKGWKLFGDTTKETDGYYQILAKHTTPKKRETESQTA